MNSINASAKKMAEITDVSREQTEGIGQISHAMRVVGMFKLRAPRGLAAA